MGKYTFTLAIFFLLLDLFTLCLPIDEKSALLAIKNDIIDPSEMLLKTWSITSNTSICSWIGVYCDANNQNVIELNLSNMSLAGIVSPAIGDLSFLTSLDISRNNFTSAIPASLGNGKKLVIIDLSFNKLTGPVPAGIFNISSLREIDLSTNNLDGSLPVDMCSYLPNVERMNLSSNWLEGRIPRSIYKCRELKHLSLDHNEFSGRIPMEIGNLTLLEHLFLGSNNLEGELVAEIGNLKLLKNLNLGNNSLEGPIPNYVFNMSSLKHLVLGENHFTGNLPSNNIHYNLPLLQSLYIHENRLQGQIPSTLWECRRLEELSLADNQFTGSISKNVGNLTFLKFLRLSRNNLTGTIPGEIGNLNIEFIRIGQNMLTGRIPSEIFNISTLDDLLLYENDLSGTLPSSMGLYVPNLKNLDLRKNMLSGSIPISISNASRLTLIQLTENSFTGPVPNTLGYLKDLGDLLISLNNLTGSLSFIDSLSNCKKLGRISIALNQFNAILPASIGNLSASVYLLQAFGSKIKGQIPAGIGNLSSLMRISLDSNALTGFIPSTLGRLENLEQVYLEYNNLQGIIPSDICRLERLGDLYVSHNKLNGHIPSCLGKIKTLRRLFLDSNNLTSTIPSTMWNLEDLLYLNLSSNSLTGIFPSDIGNLKAITQLDLSWNQFSGAIPSTIGSCQMLTVLSLWHNYLQESIPQSLGNLVNLELLDLSNNNFSGTIPKSLEALRYLEYFNVSFNRLNGKIPTGGCFVNFTAQSFMQNDGLCGVPRLQVQPCSRISRSRNLSLLKYTLPPIIATILLVAAISVYLGHKKRGMGVHNQSGLAALPNAWRRVSYFELYKATNGFSESNLLGVGGIGSVYKGILSDEVNVAVKVFNLQLEEAFKTFDVECEVLRNIRHRNLIKIISSCSSPDFLALVLEYMPNGSLEKWLYSHNYCLSMIERLKIMIDVALALEYLHHGHMVPILHCDLKPSNVLLDEDMIGHISDFGISKLLGEDELVAQTKTLATIGYMAPEYGMSGIVSTQGDVYSFGVLLMETFTRKKPTDEMFTDEMNMRSWIYDASLGSIVEVVDANLIGIESETFAAKKECVSSILHLALDCSADLPTERISIKDVVLRLKKIKVKFIERTNQSDVRATAISLP